MKKKLLLLLSCLFLYCLSFSQVIFSNPKLLTLKDVNSSSDLLLIPRVSLRFQISRVPFTSPIASEISSTTLTIVDLTTACYYRNTIKWVKKSTRLRYG